MTDHFSYIDVSSTTALEAHGITAICAAIGVFDGVHTGHQKLLNALLDQAAKTGATPVAITFFPHPRQILYPESKPVLLIPPARKKELLFESGVKAVVTIPFTKEFSAISPETFVSNYLSTEKIRLRGICVGAKWRFGASRTGDAALLMNLSIQKKFAVTFVSESVIDGEIVSSSAIRHAVISGDLAKAARFLGRPYEIFGKVIRGYGDATSELSCPTANLALSAGLIPPPGVYAAFLRGGPFRQKQPAVVNIGVSPTFAAARTENPLRVEAHLLAVDKKTDLYGADLALEPVAFLRKEFTFPSADSLKHQIERDAANAARLLNTRTKETP